MTLLTVKKAVITVAALAITFSASAQTPAVESMPKAHLEKVMQNFRSSLKSEYTGIVEGTIYNIVIFKKYYPDLDFSSVLPLLNQSAQENEDASLRFKAHLASMYLTNESGVEIVPVERPADHEYIFRQIAEQLEKKLLVSN